MDLAEKSKVVAIIKMELYAVILAARALDIGNGCLREFRGILLERRSVRFELVALVDFECWYAGFSHCKID